MNDQPLVSIIINNYNYGHFLSAAIDSALSQTYPHNEVIVVDDGSTDNSQAVIASYNNRVLPVLKENGGQASAFNAGFAASQGDIICFLDSDDVFLPEKVAEVVNTLKDYRENVWCFHPLKVVDTDTKTIVKNNYQGSVYECDLRLDIKRGRLRGKLPFSIPATSGLCFTRSLLQQILPMPEAEAISLNDSYLQFTAFALGRGFALAKELSLQRVHGNNAYSFRADKQRLVARINVLTAYSIRANFPSLYRFTNKLFAEGMGIYWRTGGIEARSQELVKNYLSSVVPLEKLKINARVFYHCLKI